jgi:hypothetical protein
MAQPTISRHPPRAAPRSTALVAAVDLGSSNGTWLYGAPRGARARGPGDELFLGDCAVVLESADGLRRRRAREASGAAQERVGPSACASTGRAAVARRAHEPGAAQDAQVLVHSTGREAPRRRARSLVGRGRAQRREDRRAAAAEQGREGLGVACAVRARWAHSEPSPRGV